MKRLPLKKRFAGRSQSAQFWHGYTHKEGFH